MGLYLQEVPGAAKCIQAEGGGVAARHGDEGTGQGTLRLTEAEVQGRAVKTVLEMDLVMIVQQRECI